MSSPPFEDYPDFAKTDDEAARRFELTKSIDPFPDIQPSLLNSADVYDYVRMTGMLYPFDASPKYLKSASYEAAISGQCIWWDAKGDQFEVQLKKDGDEFLLQANSIAFVQVAPHFRLPDYIALRFNLKITHVHRGILLGTGPLVDPGFVGRLLIPLHNLTTNPYRFRFGEGLIWVEFTKTSIYPLWSQDTKAAVGLTRKGIFHPFPKDKNDMQPEDYLRKSSPHKPIRSSIPEVGRESREFAVQAKTIAEAVEKRVKNYSYIGVAALVLTIVGLIYGTWTLIHEAWKTAKEAQFLMQNIKLEGNSEKIDALQEKLKTIQIRTSEELGGIRKQLDDVSIGIKPIQNSPVPVKQESGKGTPLK